MLLASPPHLSKPPPGLTDVNKVWHHANCQRRFAPTLFRSSELPFTSPEYAQECFLIFSSTIHTGSPSAPRLASSASCTVEQHFSGTTERIGS